jgi:transcriptional regulator with GAF, ATPase, and Fis domain
MNPRLRAISGPLKGQEFPISAAGINIGRGARNHVRVDDPLVSNKHCSLWFDYDRCGIQDCGSEHGTFVNEFSFPGQFIKHGDHIRVGRTIFVYLFDTEATEALLKLSENERGWVYGHHHPDHAGTYEPAKGTALAAMVRFNASINSIRTADGIQERTLECIFEVIPANRAAILLAGHDQNRFVSGTYRNAAAHNGEPFPVDETLLIRVLREGVSDYKDKAVCCPLTTFDTKVGVLYAEMEESGAEWFTAGHIGLIESIASSTAVALEHARYVTWLETENRRLNELLNTEHGMIGDSERMKDVYRFISRAGPNERPVLILGPSGTGKELAAYAIYRNSPRKHERFIPVNCAAFSESLLQSELFGHERGAFTGAAAQRKGLFEEADGCTLFLDEIGELPLNMQPDLLRVIQQGEVKRLGSNEVIKVDVRIIAATNRNLREEVKNGRFREDLFYRLNVFPLQLPALAERPEDIPTLAAHFIRKYRHLRQAPYPEVLGISPEAHSLLAVYGWPGNVRELENAIEWAISMGSTAYILPEDLPEDIRRRPDSPNSGASLYTREFEAFQKSLFERVIRESGRNRAEAARRLAWHPNSFRRRCNELGIE